MFQNKLPKSLGEPRGYMQVLQPTWVLRISRSYCKRILNEKPRFLLTWTEPGLKKNQQTRKHFGRKKSPKLKNRKNQQQKKDFNWKKIENRNPKIRKNRKFSIEIQLFSIFQFFNFQFFKIHCFRFFNFSIRRFFSTKNFASFLLIFFKPRQNAPENLKILSRNRENAMPWL